MSRLGAHDAIRSDIHSITTKTDNFQGHEDKYTCCIAELPPPNIYDRKK
jgi:hypothetical protein